MKIGIAFFAILSATLIISCSLIKEKRNNTYSEPSDPHPGDIAIWNTIQKGIHATVGSIDKRYEKGQSPKLK